MRKAVLPGKPGRLSETGKTAVFECVGVVQCLGRLVATIDDKDKTIKELLQTNASLDKQLAEARADVEELETEVEELQGQKDVDEAEIMNLREVSCGVNTFSSSSRAVGLQHPLISDCLLCCCLVPFPLPAPPHRSTLPTTLPWPRQLTS